MQFASTRATGLSSSRSILILRPTGRCGVRRSSKFTSDEASSPSNGRHVVLVLCCVLSEDIPVFLLWGVYGYGGLPRSSRCGF
eukprot:scaffold159502_cov33-Tisochrysis_lutea.AAC.8